jgi:hypothetical protein
VTNDWVSPGVSSTLGLLAPFALGLLLTSLGFVCSIILARIVGDRVNQASDITANRESLIVATRNLPVAFWVVGTTCAAGYAAILPFTSVFVAQRPSGLTVDMASRSLSVVFLIAALGSPILGKLIDRSDATTVVVNVSCLILCVAHLVYTVVDHMATLILLGFAYTGFVASIWPMVPIAVPESHIGLAYGMMTALQNAVLTAMPMLIAWLKAETGSYVQTRLMFLGSSVVAMAGSVWLSMNVVSTRSIHNYSLIEETQRLKDPINGQ